MKWINKLAKEKNIVSLTGNLSFAILGFSSFMILTRTLPKEEFGVWVLYVTIATFCDLGRFGLTRNAIVKFTAGKTTSEKQMYLGSSMKLELYFLLFICVLCYSLYFVFGQNIGRGFSEFLCYYPLLACCNLSWNNAVSFLQAEQEFGEILRMRSLNMGSFVLFLVVNQFSFQLGVQYIIIAHLLCNLLASLYALWKRFDGLAYLSRSTKESRLQLIHFGKYSLGTFLGGSLLRSADAFIIGLSSAMGTVAVAIYSVSMKLTELMEIPIRSFGATAFPKISKASKEENYSLVRTLFYEYTGAVILLYIPCLTVGFIWAEFWVYLVGGDKFAESIPLMALILRVFIVYGFFMPIDRMTGIVLDSLNHPEKNFYKVLIMASANIIGDLIAVFLFKSLVVVAMVSILFLFCGIGFGAFYLQKYASIHLWKIVPYGIRFYKRLFLKLRHRVVSNH